MKPQKIIAIAASTGGVEALEKVIARLPANIPPAILVIHMPPGFTKLFAARMDARVACSLKEAETGDKPKQGQILVAPSGKHIKLVNTPTGPQVECFVGPKMHGVMPAADILFDSVADIQRSNAIGVILTGMGADGAEGLLKMRKNGAETIGQDKKTSAVYGMPKVAMEIGAVMHEAPIDQIANKILSLI